MDESVVVIVSVAILLVTAALVTHWLVRKARVERRIDRQYNKARDRTWRHRP